MLRFLRHEDIKLGVACAKGMRRAGKWGIESFVNAAKTSRPIYYLNEEVRRRRHLTWKRIVEEEEKIFSPFL
jgi:hypothetical protein